MVLRLATTFEWTLSTSFPDREWLSMSPCCLCNLAPALVPACWPVQKLCGSAEMLPVGHKRKRVQTKLFGDDFVRDDLRPGKSARRRKVMEPGGPDEAQGADALLSLAALAEQAESDTGSGDEGMLLHCCTLLMKHNLKKS